MAGLDAVSSNILPGEIVAPTDVAPTGGLTTVKAPTSKGGFNVGTVAIDPTNTAAILENMQKFLDERKQTDAGKFIQGLNEASMSLYHPEAFVEYQKANQAKAKDYMDMQNQMAALKSAQAMQDLQRKQVNKALGVAPAGGSTASDGSAPSGVPDSVISQIDPAILAQIKDLTITSPAAAQALLQKTLESMNLERFKTREGFKYNPVSQKPEVYTITTDKGVEQVDLTPDQWMQAQSTGKLPDGRSIYSGAPKAPAAQAQAPAAQAQVQSGGYKGVAADVNNPVGIGGAGNFTKYGSPQEGVQAAVDLNARYVKGQGPMQGIAPTVENMTSVWATGKPGASPPGYSTFVKQELAKNNVKLNPDSTVPDTPEAIKALTAARIKFESGKNAGKFLPYLETPAAPATTSTAPATTSTASATKAAEMGPNEARVTADWAATPATNSKDIAKKDAQITAARAADIALASKKAESTQTSELKSTDAERQKAGEFISKIQDLAHKAPNVIKNTDRVIGHATTHPEEFGWGYEGGPRSLAINAPEVVPFLGHDISKGVEKVLQGFQGKDVATRRANTDAAAASLGFDFAAETFTGTGARLGLGLEQMANKAKSVGSEYPAATNILNAKVIKYAYAKAQEQSAAWDKYKSSHENADPFAFTHSPEYISIDKKWNDKADELVPEYKKLMPEEFKDVGTPSGRKPLSSFHKQG